MTTLCSTPESLPSPRAADAAPSGFQPPSEPGQRGYDAPGFPSGGTPSSYTPRNDQDYEVPFFTVAHYRTPTAPTTYEYAATHGFQDPMGDALYNGTLDPAMSPVELAFGGTVAWPPQDHPSITPSSRSPTVPLHTPALSPTTPLHTPARSPPTPHHTPARSPTTPLPGTDEVDCGVPPHASTPFVRRTYGGHDRTPLGCLHAAAGTSPWGQKPPTPTGKPGHDAPSSRPPRTARTHDDTPVRGAVGFNFDQPSPPRPTRTPSRSRSGSRRRTSSPSKRTTPTTPTAPSTDPTTPTPASPRDTSAPKDPAHDPPSRQGSFVGRSGSKENLTASGRGRDEGRGSKDDITGSGRGEGRGSKDDITGSGRGRDEGRGGGKDATMTASMGSGAMDGSGVYEDAGVSDAGDRLESALQSSSSSEVMVTPRTPRTPRTARSKSREPSFCLELEDEEYPRTEAEYMALLHAKIAEAHERQLLPLKEDLADWLSKLLGAEDLSAENLIEKLDNGVYVCRLAEVISRRAQDARDKETSNLEVPRLPYRTWERARSGTFFARDNISNFLRFCRRLGVHDNLLFETEDLVCHAGARGVVLCLLEVGRLAQAWWGLEPPGIVKLEREMDGEEWSGSGYSNTSSPRGSTLALHPAAPSPPAADTKLPRPRSAPGHLQLVPRLVLPNQSTHTQTDSPPSSQSKIPRTSTPKAVKPTPPPKPASIRRAVSNLAKRPTTIPKKSRGWSGAKTTPTTPVTTPTHTGKPRLPSARTPRSSGRSTPNTTPTTPTHCRRYMSSLQRTPATPRPLSVSRPASRPASKTPSRSPSICSRLQECYNTVQPDSVAQAHRTDLDNKVFEIANQTRGYCSCKEEDCKKSHIKRVADGKYEICGRNVFVRLLKGKHVMVRVGGGWDTLEHYLLRHDPKQVTVFNLKSSEPFLHIRAKYCSPTHSRASSSRGSPSHSQATASRGTASRDPTPGNTSSEGTPPPPPEPQVPTSLPAESSSTESCTLNFVDSSPASVQMDSSSAMQTSGSRQEMEAACSLSENMQNSDLYIDGLQSDMTEGDSNSPIAERAMVNSATFCVDDNNRDESLPLISVPSNMSTSSSSSSSDLSGSLKVTPPATPSTFSTPACANSNDLSLTPDGSSTTVGTPLPHDYVDQDEL